MFSFYTLIISAMYTFQKKFVFQPVKLEKSFNFTFENTFKEYFLQCEIGENINALFFPSEKTSKGLILYFHGNSKNLNHWGKISGDFTNRGYDIFLIDYKGYGKSEGETTEENFYIAGKLAYDWALNKYPVEKITIFGRSLGTAVASKIAAEYPAKMLILETPFYSMNDLLKERFPYLLFPMDSKMDFPIHKYLNKVKYPIHVFHGTGDKITPYSSSLKLKPLLKPTDTFTTIKNGKHRNLNTFDKYHSQLNSIL